MKVRNPSSPSIGVQNWRELYTAALFETDRQKLPSRIAEAEKALIPRARELFAMSGDTTEEAQAVDDALYALRARRNCSKLKTNDPTAAYTLLPFIGNKLLNALRRCVGKSGYLAHCESCPLDTRKEYLRRGCWRSHSKVSPIESPPLRCLTSIEEGHILRTLRPEGEGALPWQL